MGVRVPGRREYFEQGGAKTFQLRVAVADRVLPFLRHSRRSVLEVGCGAGYDAYEFLRHGANYTGIDITPENIDRTRVHLHAVGLEGVLQVADAERLPFGAESFDLYFSNGVLHHVPKLEVALGEAFRVLKPGGEVWITVYNRDSVFYWLTLYLQHWWLMGERHHYQAFADRLSEIEFTTSDERPVVNVYSAREIEGFVSNAGLASVRNCVRKLVHADLPFGDRWPMRAIPQSILDVYARRFGWYIIVRAKKPVRGGRTPSTK